jgi:hypothetical protein
MNAWRIENLVESRIKIVVGHITAIFYAVKKNVRHHFLVMFSLRMSGGCEEKFFLCYIAFIHSSSVPFFFSSFFLLT